MRYVIAVSRLIPHGTSIVPRDQSSQVLPPFVSASISSALQSDRLLGVLFISDAPLLSQPALQRKNERQDS